MSLYSRQAEPQIWENSLNSEISQKIVQFFSLLHSPCVGFLCMLDRTVTLSGPSRLSSLVNREPRQCSWCFTLEKDWTRRDGKLAEHDETRYLWLCWRTERRRKLMLSSEPITEKSPRRRTICIPILIFTRISASPKYRHEKIGFIRATETLRKNWNKQFDIRIDDNSSKIIF